LKSRLARLIMAGALPRKRRINAQTEK
jgi:hypothetical protein